MSVNRHGWSRACFFCAHISIQPARLWIDSVKLDRLDNVLRLGNLSRLCFGTISSQDTRRLGRHRVAGAPGGTTA
jgi:hypothetical protein